MRTSVLPYKTAPDGVVPTSEPEEEDLVDLYSAYHRWERRRPGVFCDPFDAERSDGGELIIPRGLLRLRKGDRRDRRIDAEEAFIASTEAAAADESGACGDPSGAIPVPSASTATAPVRKHLRRYSDRPMLPRDRARHQLKTWSYDVKPDTTPSTPAAPRRKRFRRHSDSPMLKHDQSCANCQEVNVLEEQDARSRLAKRVEELEALVSRLEKENRLLRMRDSETDM
ncbi:hypothetical protein K474DRAFT_1713682 [Panus rudis PR-1116 ss-1]|nr:hypothetical protein K474DRAFT_1713682 [Panus rudis PR-1116 ss-1]